MTRESRRDSGGGNAFKPLSISEKHVFDGTSRMACVSQEPACVSGFDCDLPCLFE